MLPNSQKVFKIQLKQDRPTPPPFSQRVNMSRGCPILSCPIEEICYNPEFNELILEYYTTHSGNSLVLGAQLFEDELCTIPVTNFDTGAPYRTQLQGQVPDSTIVSFDSVGVVVQVLGDC